MPKLPGLDYTTQVAGTLGRGDVSAPIRLAKAKGAAAEAISDTARTYYQNESKAQAFKAQTDYAATVNTLELDAQKMRVAGVPLSEIAERSNQARVDARAGANVGMSELAQNIFADKATVSDLRTDASWNATQFQWAREDAVADGLKLTEQQINNDEYESARATHEEIRADLSPAQNANMSAEIDTAQQVFGFKSATAQSLGSSKQTASLLTRIEGAKDIDQGVKDMLKAHVTQETVNYENTLYYSAVNDVFEANGILAADQEAERMLTEITNATPEAYGLDQVQFTQLRNQIASTRSWWRAQRERSVQSVRTEQDAFNIDVVDPKSGHNMSQYDNLYDIVVAGGIPDGKQIVDTMGITEILASPEALENTYKLGTMFQALPNEFMKSMDAILVGGNDEQKMAALGAMEGLMLQPNGIAIMNNSKGAEKWQDVMDYKALAGGTDAAGIDALAWYGRRNSISETDQKTAAELINNPKSLYNENYKDNAENAMERVLPAESWFGWSTKNPLLVPGADRDLKLLTDKILPTVGGNVVRASELAAMQMARSFSTSTANPDSDIMRYAPERYVTSQQNAEVVAGPWVRNQPVEAMRQSLKRVLISNDLEFDASKVKVTATEIFDPQNPTYKINYYEPELMGQQMTTAGFEYDYDSSATAREKIAERDEVMADAKNEQAVARLAAMVDAGQVELPVVGLRLGGETMTAPDGTVVTAIEVNRLINRRKAKQIGKSAIDVYSTVVGGAVAPPIR